MATSIAIVSTPYSTRRCLQSHFRLLRLALPSCVAHEVPRAISKGCPGNAGCGNGLLYLGAGGEAVWCGEHRVIGCRKSIVMR